jgi:tyrocidine synthetase-3
MLKAHAHQLYPFDKLVGDLGGARRSGVSPLYDVVVVLQNLEVHKKETHSMGEMLITTLELDVVAASMDLRLEFIERSDHIDLNFEYDPHLFGPATISRFMDRFLLLLAKVLADPAIRVADIGFENGPVPEASGNLPNHFTHTF